PQEHPERNLVAWLRNFPCPEEDMLNEEKQRIAEKHQPHWAGLWIWLSFAAAFFIFQGALAASLAKGFVVASVVLVLLLGHLMHAHLIAFHEAAHGSLCPNRRLNDALGRFIGLFSFMSLSLYRAVHHTHHTFLAGVRDEELWPFVIPAAPRWLRCLAA